MPIRHYQSNKVQRTVLIAGLPSNAIESRIKTHDDS
jgi:hypothetical protein